MTTKKKTPPKGGRSRTNSRPSPSKKSSSKRTPKGTPRQLKLADLKRSGLTDRDAKKLGYKLLTPKQTRERTDFEVTSYLIPYHDINGKLTEFWRVRYLEEIRGPFGAIKKKPPRYSQARDTLPRFYFAKTTPAPWKDLVKNTKVGLVITEGEKKAAKACKEGIPAISVGGVWAWRSKKHGLAAIPDFNLIDWKDRDVRLCFDNDLISNPLVIGALNALAHELINRGAVVYVVYLPKGPGKIGLDDYLVKRSVASFLKLDTEEYKESAALWEFNEDVCYIRKLKAFYSFELKILFKTKAELLTAFERLSYQVPRADGNGFKTLYVAAEWCRWPHRQEYKDLVYAPGEANIVDGCLVNLWNGWGVEPKKGDVRPFYDLVNFIFADDPDLQAWLLCWFAYPLQYPGTKLNQAVLLHSRTQGVGKTLLGEIMGDIYGENFNTVSQDELHSSFNDWVAKKQFILGEELSGTNTKGDADRLKNMFTRELYNVNVKYQPTYILKDCANYFLTSNRVDALFMDDDDRRAFVHEIRSKAKPLAFYKRISAWRRNGGASHLFYHLLNDIDTSNFEPKGRAPMTEAKRQMIDATKSDQDIFVSRMLDNPDEVLRTGRKIVPKDLFTLSEIVSFFNAQNSRPSSAPLVSKALRSAGIQPHQIATIDGTKKLWPCRNTDAWYRRDWGEWKAHYKKHRRSIKYK